MRGTQNTASRTQQVSQIRWTPPPPRPTVSSQSNVSTATYTPSAPSTRNWSAEPETSRRNSRDNIPPRPFQRPRPSPVPAQNASQFSRSSSITPKSWSRPQPQASFVVETHQPPSSQKPPFAPGSISSRKWDSVVPAPSSSTASLAETSRWRPHTRDTKSYSSPDARSPHISRGPIPFGTRFQEPVNRGPTQPSQPRTLPSAKELKSKVQPRRRSQKRRDVFIPSTLTVASLASILRVKLGQFLYHGLFYEVNVNQNPRLLAEGDEACRNDRRSELRL